MRTSAMLLPLIITCALVPLASHAEAIDTEHLFAFMIGTDVGDVGEREFQNQTTGRFAKSTGSYRALTEAAEFEYVPIKNFRAEFSAVAASYDIGGVAGFDDLRQTGVQGVALDLRYRLLDKDAAPFGLTFAAETHADRMDETSGQHVRAYGTDFALAFDRELIPNRLVTAVNLLYQPQWTNFLATGGTEHDATIGVAWAMMAQVKPGLLVGGEARYLRKYEGFGLDIFAGQALFVGPTIFIRLSERSRLTAAWSFQVSGRSAAMTGSLDLVDFERHQARVIYGIDF
ncbi:MAG TPA: hypothetical protein VN065_20685 [Bradyrhizobium sp.]|jgi:hypothetical protein|nr:hypothetical protein [Bradyrhizobium sp.]